MKLKNILLTIFFTFLFLLTTSSVFAQTKPDIRMNTYTKIYYTTEQNHVTIVNEYERLIENSSLFFTKGGEKIFHIPDVGTDPESIQKEREFKLASLKVTDNRNNPVHFTKQESNIGEGMYIHIPYYRTIEKNSPFRISMTYDTHDNVVKSGNLVTIVASSLPTDTVFVRNNEVTDVKNKTTINTTTEFNYNLSIITDKNISTLAKSYTPFTKEEKDDKIYYNFAAEDRIEKSPMLEFGTSVIYRFELEYKTPKTDNLIPSQVSDVFQAVSTNIYEISLPREFAETNQKVLIDEISPLPKNIFLDKEGNVIASFETPANKEDMIKVKGYISSRQNTWNQEEKNPLDINLNEYLNKIREDKESNNYLLPTKYWEVKDPFIQNKAQELKENTVTLYELVDNVYQYVNDTLTYDEAKADSENERIGAVKALTGGASVCMEYADSMIAILRAQGIPARAALGYANITDESTDLVRHQWLQIWIPDYGWLSIDPTFESSNRKMGQLIDRVLWETFSDETLSNISLYTADRTSNFSADNLSIRIHAIDNIPAGENKKYSEILPNINIEDSTKYTVENWTNSLLKTTVLGKALLVSLPIIVTLALSILLITLIKSIVGKIKRGKNPKTEKSLTNRPIKNKPISYS